MVPRPYNQVVTPTLFVVSTHPFQAKCHPSKAFSQKRPWLETKNRLLSPLHQTTPSESLDCGPTFLVMVGYKLVVLRLLCVCSTPSVFVFFHSHVISAIAGQFCFILLHVRSTCAYPLWRMTWAFLFRLTLFSSVPSWARGFAWHDFLPNRSIGLSFLSFFLPQAFMAHLLLSCFAFTSYCAYGPICCHFLPCQPTGLYFFISFFLSSLGFYGPFVSILHCFYLFLFIFCLLLALFFNKKWVSTLI